MTHIWVVDAGRNPHILTLSPPLNIDAKWFKDHTAYTISKFGMSMCVLGMSAEFKVRVVLPPSGFLSSWPTAHPISTTQDRGVAVNALWPKTGIGAHPLPSSAPFSRHTCLTFPGVCACSDCGHPKRAGWR